MKPEKDVTAASTPAARRTKRVVVACAVVFLLALGVRALHWQDNRQHMPWVGMAEEYKAHTLALVRGDLRGFLRGPDPPSNADVVKHPLGYPVFQAAVIKLAGTSDAAMRFVHVALDSLAAVLVLLIALELLPFAAATVAGLLVALSPQLAYHSIALVPDPVCVPPLLLAFYLLTRAVKRPRLLTVAAAGACLGVSCLLRSNAMLLPFFVAALSPLLFARGRRLRCAAALVGAFLLVIAPNTIRNVLVFRSFIPLSLSAGITMVEGIAAYDKEKRFGLPENDYQVTKWEAEEFKRPDYLGTRFAPDGVKREQHRIARGLRVIRQNPVWFLGVMLDRATFMLRLARVEIVAAEPAATRPLDVSNKSPALSIPPKELAASVNNLSAQAETSHTGDSLTLRFEGDSETGFVASAPFDVRASTDHLIKLPLKIKQGSVVIDIIEADSNRVLASTPVLHPVNWLDLTPESQPFINYERPFVSGAGRVRVALRSGSRRPAAVEVEVGRAEVYELGPASYTWTRHPRALVRAVQKLFLTAFVLPFVFVGIFLIARARRWRELALLLVVPAYYMCVQSALWTEFRYILAMHYFLPILAAAGLFWAFKMLRQAATKIVKPAPPKNT